MHDVIARAIELLTAELRANREQRISELELARSHSCLATKSDLNHVLNTIMSAISDFAAAQSAFQDQIDTAVSGLTGDVKNLADQIAKLQSTPGTITAEDQALLDGIQTRTKGIADKLAALDALTPPVVPPAV